MSKMFIKRKLVTLFSILLLITLLISCNKNEENVTNKKLKVTVTIATYADFVKKIGGDKVEVNILVPPNAEPHNYEPQPAQISELAKSDLYVKIGAGMGFEESFSEKIKSINKKIKIINSAEGINIYNNDPHVWLGINEARIIVKNIYKNLVKELPADSVYFTNNLDKFLNLLLVEEMKIKEAFSKRKTDYVLVYHPAWHYFFNGFGIIQLGIEKDGKEPNARDLQEVINISKKNNVRVVFIEPQFNKESAMAIAKQLNASIDVINNIPTDYIKNLEIVRRKVSKSLL